MANRIGQQFGSYRLARRLGGGGFAEVYLGQHVRVATQQAAIKILQLTNVDEQQFQQEAERTAVLHHPYIVQLYDFDIQEDIPFLVLQYAPNGSLARHEGQRLPLDIIIQYINQIASALQYAHDRNIVHRDIKPDNVLVGSQGELLVSDFGIAVISKTGRTSLQSNYNVGGTPFYMAPEMFRGKPEKASDQYALGVMVYEWLCGRRPFTEGNPIQLGYQHTHESAPLLRSLVPLISEYVEKVVITALAKEPQRRFASVRAFATALEQAGEANRFYASHSMPAQPLAPPPRPAAPPFVVQSGPITAPSGPRTVTPPVRQPVRELLPNQALPPSFYTVPARIPAGQPTAQTSSPRKRGISRRAVVIGIVSGAVAIAGGGITWYALSQSPAGTTFYVYGGHSDVVTSVAWSPDGSRIASASDDKTVQVWNASDGSNVYIYRGHSDVVTSVAWSPDGSRIASAGNDDTVQVWNASDGSNAFIYRGHSDFVTSVAWSPDRSRIASAGNDETVQVWNASDGSHIFTYQKHSKIVTSVAWSSDGSRIASGSGDETVQVWNASDGSNVYIYHGHSDVVTSVAWSPDGSRIASAGNDNTVQVWNASNGSNPYIYGDHANVVNTVAWAADGRRIASGGADNTVRVWEGVQFFL